MRILLLTPGTGSFLCGSCLRDNALALALRAAGADATIVPLYLPFALEEEAPESMAPVRAPVRMGGINVWLAEHVPFWARLPRRWRERLDSPRLLRFVASRANMTSASGLGAMTLSMLKGEEGRQRTELRELVEWIQTIEPPDVILLSNAMLAGLARELRSALGCPVVCTLQGEAPFLDALPAPYREQAWSCLAERAAELDAFVAVSHYTAELMGARLELPSARVHVVWNGIDSAEISMDDRAPADGPPTVGYLARMCADKGLATLFDAFELAKERVPEARLRAAGVVLAGDVELVERCRARARARGFEDDVSFTANVGRREKIELLRSLTVFSVPATYGESFGLYVLEAWAAGVPVVLPRHGGFVELVEATGAGLLCEPDDPAALADGLVRLLSDPAQARELGRRGAAAVRERFTTERMASDVLTVCRQVAAPGGAS